MIIYFVDPVDTQTMSGWHLILFKRKIRHCQHCLSGSMVSKDAASKSQVLVRSRVHPGAPEPWMSKPPSWLLVTPGPLAPGVGPPASDGGGPGAGVTRGRGLITSGPCPDTDTWLMSPGASFRVTDTQTMEWWISHLCRLDCFRLMWLKENRINHLWKNLTNNECKCSKYRLCLLHATKEWSQFLGILFYQTSPSSVVVADSQRQLRLLNVTLHWLWPLRCPSHACMASHYKE